MSVSLILAGQIIKLISECEGVHAKASERVCLHAFVCVCVTEGYQPTSVFQGQE